MIALGDGYGIVAGAVHLGVPALFFMKRSNTWNTVSCDVDFAMKDAGLPIDATLTYPARSD